MNVHDHNVSPHHPVVTTPPSGLAHQLMNFLPSALPTRLAGKGEIVLPTLFSEPTLLLVDGAREVWGEG